MSACSVSGCTDERVKGSLVCRGHLDDLWANRLQRAADGQYLEFKPMLARRASDLVSPFVRNAMSHSLPAKAL